MDSCIHKKFEGKEFGGDEPKANRYECHDCEDSREERLEEESDDKLMEEKIRVNALLRSSDSDAEEYDSVGDHDSAKTVEKEPEVRKEETKPPEPVVVSVNLMGDSVGDSAANTRQTKIWRNRRNASNDRIPKKMSIKWGEAVGIYDEKGCPKRVVEQSEIRNYIRLKMQTRSQFQFMFALIHPRFPQLYKVFSEAKQRWRMRYNIFVNGLLPEWKKSVHVGEIIIYFDVARHLSHPFYTNCSFYPNYQPLERDVDNSLLTKMICRLHDLLTSNHMLQLKFPIPEDAFNNPTNLVDRFRFNETELMEELNIIRGGSKSKFSPSIRNWLTISRDGRPRKHRPNAPSDIDFFPRSSTRRKKGGEGRARKENRYVDVQRGAAISERRGGDRKRDRQSNKNSDQSHCGHGIRESETETKRTNDKNQTKNSSKQTSQRRNRNNERIDGTDPEFGAVNQYRSGRIGERQSRPKTRFR